MPSWAASVPRSMSLLKARGIGCFPVALRCPTATKLSLPQAPKLRIRFASTYVSPTAINLQANIPPTNKDLYDALSQLGVAAEIYVNLSRLQLALRGLTSQDAVTRIAVLGLESQSSARKLARLLLADPLGNEEGWERQLGRVSDEGERAMLLRFGDESDAHPPNPLYETVSIPSRVLQTHNLEILVSTLNTDISRNVVSTLAEDSSTAILVPQLQSSSARGLPVPFPVHKTLLVGEGLESAVSYGRFTSDNNGDMAGMVQLAIDLPPPLKETESMDSTYSTINIETGMDALRIFRQSIANSAIYERGWFRSGMPVLSQWLVQGLLPAEPIKPATKALISSIAEETDAKITGVDAEQLQKLTHSTANRETTKSILGHLESWAEKSHTELRDQLDEAFSARNWHKLAWWKLLWRVDDVSMIMSEIVERRWLVDAEKNGIYLAGRMNQAGLPEDIHDLIISAPRDTKAGPVGGESVEMATQNTGVSTEVRQPQPWPSQIATSRSALLEETIPPLQALAQRLLLQTFSTTSLGSALSALLYVSVSSFSVFDACAVAALGLVFSLRRLQKLWENGREMWQVEVREEGRRTLKHTEDLVRLIISSSEKKPVVEDEGAEERRLAREAVQRVQEALEKM